MLNKLKTWKDSLIDKVTNVSLKNVKVSKTSFRVSSFILSLVLICTISSIMFMNKSTRSNAEANPTLLADSNLLYCEDLENDDYRFYFYDGTNGSVKDNNGYVLSDFILSKYTYGAAGNLYLFENSTSDEDDNILILDGTFALTGKNTSPFDLEIGNTKTSTNKIVASKNGATLTGDASYAFCQFGKLKYFDSTNFNTTGVTNMKSMFALCSKLVSCDLSHFDTTSVTDMSNMFNIDTALRDLDISNFDTSNVTNMAGMFYGCSKLYRLDLNFSGFDTSNVTNMSSMFFGCQSLATINVSNFDTASVTNMSSMFMDCLNLKSLDLSKMSFNTSNVTNMSNMFRGLKNLSVLNLSGLTKIAATNTDMFLESNIDRIILPLNVSNNALLPTYTDFKYIGCDIYGSRTTDVIGTTLMKRIDNVNPGTLEAGELYQLIKVPNSYDSELYIDENNLKFYHDKILDGNNSDNDITSYFNVYKVSLINNYVKLNTGLADPSESDIENKKLEIVNDKNTIGAYFYIPKDTGDTGIYKNDATLVLHGLKYEDKDTTLNIHSKVKVPAENGTAFAYLNSCDVYKLDGGTYRVINETSDPECYHDVSGVSTKNLYGDLIKLIDKAYISLIGYAAPSFSDAFNGARKVTTLDLGSRIDFSMYESYTANRMFQQMSNVTYINMGAFDGNLSQTAYMFYKCTNLETIDNATYMIDSNKAGLKDIKFMFSNCESLKNIDWSHWDVSKINNAEHAFSCMHSIDTFDFSNWDCKLSVVQSMFAAVECDNPIIFGNMNFDDVTSIFSFYQDATLPYYDYTIFKNSTLQNVTFSGYGNKNTIDFEGVDFSNVNSMYGDHDVHFGTMGNADKIILPSANYGREGTLDTYPQYMTLGNQIKKIWQGYSKNSSTGELEAIDNYYVYDGYVPVAGSDYTGTLYAIKQVDAEAMTVIDGKYYYKNQWVQGTTKHNILTYYDVDGYARPCVWDISKAQDNSIMCYIYDDGTMLFDGAGPIKGAGDGYTNNESIPWRMTYKDKNGNDFIPIDNVTKIIGSNAGFKPEGSLAYYFSPVTIQDTGLKNHIKTVDVTNFDTSKVNCFDFTFSGINNVDGIEFINIDKLNTSMAQSMKSMFEGVNCASLDLHATIDDTDPLNVKKYWDVSKVHDFGNMFYSARIDTVNLDNWNLDSTYTDSNGINFAGTFGFVYAAHIKNLSLNNWNNTGKANPAKFLAYVCDLNSVDLSSFNFEINQESVSFLYHRSSVNEIILPNTLSADKINVLSDWDVVQQSGYYGCNKDGEVVTTMPYKYLIGKVDSNGDGDFLDKTDIYMFKLISDTLYTDSDTDISYYRGGTSKSSGADAVTLVKEFDVTNTAGPNNTPAGSVKAYLYSNGLLIFDGEGDIKMSLDYNDLGPSNTEPEQLEFLTDTYRNQIKNIVGSIRGFKPSGTLRYFCYNMDNLETFDGTKFDLTNVNNLMCMFENPDADGESKLTSVIFGNTNTNSITSLNSMFDRCKSLTNVNLGNNTFTSVNNTAYMFNDCTSIETIDLSSLNCELTGCKYMFGGTTNLTSVILGDDTNGYNITLNTDDISCMFTNTGLTSVDFTKFKESKNSIKKIEGAAGFNLNTTLINLHGLDLSLATLANQSGDSDADKEKRRLFYSASWDYDDYKDTNTIETIILPSNVPTGTDALYLPVVTDHVWQGYKADGVTPVGGQFTTLPKAGEVTDLYMIKLEEYTTIFTYHGRDYSRSDVLYSWDVSNNLDKKVMAYYFLDSDDNNKGTVLIVNHSENSNDGDNDIEYIWSAVVKSDNGNLKFLDNESGVLFNYLPGHDELDSNAMKSIFTSNPNLEATSDDYYDNPYKYIAPWTIMTALTDYKVDKFEFLNPIELKHFNGFFVGLKDTVVDFTNVKYLDYADALSNNAVKAQYALNYSNNVTLKFNGDTKTFEFLLGNVNNSHTILDFRNANLLLSNYNDPTRNKMTLLSTINSFDKLYVPNLLKNVNDRNVKDFLSVRELPQIYEVYKEKSGSETSDTFVGYTYEIFDKTNALYCDASHDTYIKPITEYSLYALFDFYINGLNDDKFTPFIYDFDLNSLDEVYAYFFVMLQSRTSDNPYSLNLMRYLLTSEHYDMKEVFLLPYMELLDVSNIELNPSVMDIYYFDLYTKALKYVKEKVNEDLSDGIYSVDRITKFDLDNDETNNNEYFYHIRKYFNDYLEAVLYPAIEIENNVTVLNYLDDIVLNVKNSIEELSDKFYKLFERKEKYSDNSSIRDIKFFDFNGFDFDNESISDIDPSDINDYELSFNEVFTDDDCLIYNCISGSGDITFTDESTSDNYVLKTILDKDILDASYKSLYSLFWIYTLDEDGKIDTDSIIDLPITYSYTLSDDFKKEHDSDFIGADAIKEYYIYDSNLSSTYNLSNDFMTEKIKNDTSNSSYAEINNAIRSNLIFFDFIKDEFDNYNYIDDGEIEITITIPKKAKVYTQKEIVNDELKDNNSLTLEEKKLFDADNIKLKADEIGNFSYFVRSLMLNDLSSKYLNTNKVNVTVNALDLTEPVNASDDKITVNLGTIDLFVDASTPIEPEVTSVVYTNNAGMPITLIEDTDYTVSYGANNAPGVGTVTITGISPNTIGSRTINFTITDSVIRLKLSDINLGTYNSNDEKEIVKYKDGTNNRTPDDITSFSSSELHPYIVYNDGVSDNKIYLDYTNAYISDNDASHTPIFVAGETLSTNPKTKRNIYFEGLKLKDSYLGTYKLYADDLTTEINSTNSNDSFLITNASYLLDKDEPMINSISKDASVSSSLSFNDELILFVEFSEELKNSINKNDIELYYQIGSIFVDNDDNFKLTIKEDSDITYSDSDNKTVIKFTGKIPSDIGLIVDSPIKINSLKRSDTASDTIYDVSGNELDRDVTNKFNDTILVNTKESYTKKVINDIIGNGSDIDITDPSVNNPSDIEKVKIAFEKLDSSIRNDIKDSNYVTILDKKYYGDDNDTITYPGVVIPGDKDVTNLDGNDNESVEIFGTVSALESDPMYARKIKLVVEKITDTSSISDIETKLKNKVLGYKEDEVNLSSYKIKLVDTNNGNVEVEPDSGDMILVRLELPNNLFNKVNKLYHILDDGSVETLNPIEKGKYNINNEDKYYIYFETDKFSSFTLTMLTGIKPQPDPDPIKPEPEKPISTQTITVQVVKNNKYIEGYSDGTFKPNENITRGEFSKMLAYISNNYSDSNKLDYSRYINSFKDINASDWYSSYVGFNNKKQVMVGYSDGTFRPNKELTRAEAAKALTNMFSINTTNNNVNTNIASTFNNELNGKWYEYSMKKLINAGLLKGYPDGLLRPNDPITRAEMVALINRITNRDINNNAINNNSNLRNIPYDVDSNMWYYKDIISALNDY